MTVIYNLILKNTLSEFSTFEHQKQIKNRH